MKPGVAVVATGEVSYQTRTGRLSADPFIAAGQGESTARQVTIDPVPTRTPHLHPHSEEVIYVVSGRGRVWIDGIFHPVAAGTWYRIPARTPHATVADAGEQLLLVCFFPHNDFDNNIEELDTVLDLNQEESE